MSHGQRELLRLVSLMDVPGPKEPFAGMSTRAMVVQVLRELLRRLQRRLGWGR